MSGRWQRLAAWRPGRRAALGLCGRVWVVLMATVAVPRWQQVQRQHGEVADLQQRLADLDRWTVAGLWLAPAVASREPAVTAAWHRLYPPERDREELFLALAGVADRCGVEGFAQEEDSAMDAMGSHWSRPGDVDPAMADDAPPPSDADAGLAGARPAPVTIALDRYRVRTRVQADSARIAACASGGRSER